MRAWLQGAGKVRHPTRPGHRTSSPFSQRVSDACPDEAVKGAGLSDVVHSADEAPADAVGGRSMRPDRDRNRDRTSLVLREISHKSNGSSPVPLITILLATPPGMTAVCAQRTARIDVKWSLLGRDGARRNCGLAETSFESAGRPVAKTEGVRQARQRDSGCDPGRGGVAQLAGP